MWRGSGVNRADFRIGDHFAFVHQEDEIGVADADSVSVIDRPAADGDSIDEGSVAAVEVDEFELETVLLDGAVSPRDCGIDQTQLAGFVTANGEQTIDEWLNGACQ